MRRAGPPRLTSSPPGPPSYLLPTWFTPSHLLPSKTARRPPKRTTRGRRSVFKADQRHAVADRKQHRQGPRVGHHAIVEVVHHVAALEDLPAAQRVVGDDQAALGEFRHERLV